MSCVTAVAAALTVAVTVISVALFTTTGPKDTAAELARTSPAAKPVPVNVICVCSPLTKLEGVTAVAIGAALISRALFDVPADVVTTTESAPTMALVGVSVATSFVEVAPGATLSDKDEPPCFNTTPLVLVNGVRCVPVITIN